MHTGKTGIIAVLLILIPCNGSISEMTDLQSHIWKGEYKRAVSKLTDFNDPQKASYLMMADEFDGALDVSGDKSSFRSAMIMYRKEEWSAVIDLTDGKGFNDPWLDAYRLMIRTSSFVKLGLLSDAQSESREILSLIDSFPDIRKHHLFDDLIALIAGSAFDDLIKSSPYPDSDLFENASAGNLLLISSICYKRGEAASGREFLLSALERRINAEDGERLEDLMTDPSFDPDSLEAEKVFEIARFCASRGMEKLSMKMIRSIRGNPRYENEVKFLKGCLEEKKGRYARSRKIFSDIFRSDAAVSMKKESLLKIARIDYSKKRYGNAASNFRLFGLYYPSDRRSVVLLDQAARIYVSENNWEKALETWEFIRNRGASSDVGKNALLGEAVLCHWLGRNEKAAGILRGLLEVSDHLSRPAILYWLSMTDEKSESESWRRQLYDMYPDSFYSRAASDEDDFFKVNPDHSGSPESLRNIESIELSKYAVAAAKLADPAAIRGHSAWKAFCYFIESGMLEEAEKCAGTLHHLFANDRESLKVLYAYSRSYGMVGTSMDILCGSGLTFPGSGSSSVLRFPVPYGRIVSEQMDKRKIPFDLIYGVIREESRFDRYAVSRSGALGLMQIMPSTGKWICDKLGVLDTDRIDMFDPELNIKIGAWYLRFLLDRSKGSVVGTLASYNAGHGRMAGWEKSFKPARDPLVALEMIGIEETRNYVKRVLGSMSVYRKLASEREALDGGEVVKIWKSTEYQAK